MARASTIIVIGASTGGVAALRSLVAGLPADFPAALLVVLHIGAHKSVLPALLDHVARLPAMHARNGDMIQAGEIYVAPPDHHLTVEPGYMRLTRGPRENWARPAIDPLFRSAAHAYGTAVIGVILTGALNDGTAGLFEIKARGGMTIVQEPSDAVDPSMPRSALAHVAIDHRAPLGELPELLLRLVTEKAATLDHASNFAGPRRRDMRASYTHAQPVAITCPDCGGALRRADLGSLTQFRCHIGHVYTAEVMIEAQANAMERSLEAAMRALGERAELCRQMTEKAATAADGPARSHWEAAGRDAEQQAVMLQKLLEGANDAGDASRQASTAD